MPAEVTALNAECEWAPQIQLKVLDDVAVNQRVSISIKAAPVEDAVTVTTKAGRGW